MNTSEAEAFAMRTKLAQAEQDLKILAAEVRAWRKTEEKEDYDSLVALGEAIHATNESDVLSRISE